ncbi:hypothetical protein ACLKA7_013838 [Drosophila subpalustris]
MGEHTNHFGAWLATVAMVGHVATPITTAAAAPNTFCPAARPVKRSLVSVIMRSYPTKYCSQPRPVSVSTSFFPIPHHRLHWVQINTLASCLGLQRDLVIVSPFLSPLHFTSSLWFHGTNNNNNNSCGQSTKVSRVLLFHGLICKTMSEDSGSSCRLS